MNFFNISTDWEKACLRGSVRRTETAAKRVLHLHAPPFRDNQWLEDISSYNEKGRLIERYSPENQVIEQESIRHLYFYDEEERLIEKQGYGEDNSAENSVKYIYAGGKMTESIHLNFLHPGSHHIFYDERCNAYTMETFNADGVLQFVQKTNFSYKRDGSRLEECYYTAEGIPPAFVRISPDTKRVITFNDDGVEIRVERYLDQWIEEIRTYNDAGQITEYKQFSAGDILASHNLYTYDENGNLAASSFKSGSELRNNLYEYDEHRNLIKAAEYKDNFLENEETHPYEYDAQKNWTKHLTIKSSRAGLLSTTELQRTITYFDF